MLDGLHRHFNDLSHDDRNITAISRECRLLLGLSPSAIEQMNARSNARRRMTLRVARDANEHVQRHMRMHARRRFEGRN